MPAYLRALGRLHRTFQAGTFPFPAKAVKKRWDKETITDEQGRLWLRLKLAAALLGVGRGTLLEWGERCPYLPLQQGISYRDEPTAFNRTSTFWLLEDREAKMPSLRDVQQAMERMPTRPPRDKMTIPETVKLLYPSLAPMSGRTKLNRKLGKIGLRAQPFVVRTADGRPHKIKVFDRYRVEQAAGIPNGPAQATAVQPATPKTRKRRGPRRSQITHEVYSACYELLAAGKSRRAVMRLVAERFADPKYAASVPKDERHVTTYAERRAQDPDDPLPWPILKKRE